jgi:hypothetical protein
MPLLYLGCVSYSYCISFLEVCDVATNVIPGPWAITGAYTAMAEVILGVELKYNCPMSMRPMNGGRYQYRHEAFLLCVDETSSPLLMTNLEMADMAGASTFLKRFRKMKGYIPQECLDRL